MNPALFENFQSKLAQGKREEATHAIAAFVASFNNIEEKALWTRQYLKAGDFGYRIRYELYEQVVFPVLLEGYRRADLWSLRWLIRTIQNLHGSRTLWQQVQYKSVQELLEELYALCPNDEDVRKELLATLIDQLGYAIHEWPAGILYGRDGASLEECDKLRQDVARAGELDIQGLHSPFLSEFELRMDEYTTRLQQSAN